MLEPYPEGVTAIVVFDSVPSVVVSTATAWVVEFEPAAGVVDDGRGPMLSSILAILLGSMGLSLLMLTGALTAFVTAFGEAATVLSDVKAAPMVMSCANASRARSQHAMRNVGLEDGLPADCLTGGFSL